MFTFPLEIYPNPANNYLTIELQQKSEIEILNPHGQIIMTTNNKDNKATINLENLSNGVYFLRVKTNKEVITKKIIKE